VSRAGWQRMGQQQLAKLHSHTVDNRPRLYSGDCSSNVEVPSMRGEWYITTVLLRMVTR
jgi:hypothetical protein